MAKYRKKPVVVEATQFKSHSSRRPRGLCFCTNGLPHIHTLEGIMSVDDEDWIITGVQGEQYPCKDAIFQATYEKVE